jgi:uncharacterized membrane protein/nitrite reductase/ring-hydroxylating ferredoxin subunit
MVRGWHVIFGLDCWPINKILVMKSKANIKGHPVHPILVIFPVAFFSASLVFDLLGFINDKPAFNDTAVYLLVGGLGAAVLAAIPGLVDYIFTVPPKSSAKKRAAKHGLTNTAMLLCFGAALFYRLSAVEVSPAIVVSMEIAGEILLCIAGWMGGTLVYRNQIGVDTRYADAGKWREESLEPVNGRVELKNTQELKTDQMWLIRVGEKRVVLARTAGGFAAFDDHCTHKGGSLAGGAMICGTVQCPWHGSQFDVNTGEVKAGPAKKKIPTYPIAEEHGKLYLVIS